MVDWHVRLQRGASPWLPQRVTPKEQQVDLVIRAVNTEAGSTFLSKKVGFISVPIPDYALRLRALAKAFNQDWPRSIGVIGMQQVMPNMKDCPVPPESDDGIRCFARILESEYSATSQHLSATPVRGEFQLPPGTPWPTDSIGLAAVVGSPWQIESQLCWPIGKDYFWYGGGSTRYLQELKLVHGSKGWRMTLYNTHLSHPGDRKNDERRNMEIENIKFAAKSRIRAGELLPIVVGDFNFHFNNSINADTMATDFSLVHHDGDKIHIWVGRRTSFPQTIGAYTALWTATTWSGGHVLDGISLPKLTGDHNSPSVGFNIEI